jgi:hypothetical protein
LLAEFQVEIGAIPFQTYDAGDAECELQIGAVIPNMISRRRTANYYLYGETHGNALVER